MNDTTTPMTYEDWLLVARTNGLLADAQRRLGEALQVSLRNTDLPPLHDYVSFYMERVAVFCDDIPDSRATPIITPQIHPLYALLRRVYAGATAQPPVPMGTLQDDIDTAFGLVVRMRRDLDALLADGFTTA
jgi:hypothetical protein